MPDIVRLDEITEPNPLLVGGKASNLGLMAPHNLRVPPGFVLTTEAYRRLDGQSPASELQLSAVICAAYRELGAGPVAVRSSAAVEDGDDASFAGQFETVLNVVGDDALIDAIARVWASAANPRVQSYSRERGLRAGPEIAVLVQRMAQADVAGVVFTRDPLNSAAMLIEAAPGLGTAVVSGSVQPEQIRLHAIDGTIISRSGPPCLDDDAAESLAAICRQAENHFGPPLDIEWSRADGQFWILQARPITASARAFRDAVIRGEIERLHLIAAPGRTIWVRDNLIEGLPSPTPMTWALLKKLLSPSGGMGRMLRDFGLTPNAALPDTGVYDLIAGRPYRNLDRDMNEVDRTLGPGPALRPGRMALGFLLRLPMVLWRLVRNNRRIAKIARTFAERFRSEIIPPFVRDCGIEAQADYAALPTLALFERLDRWAERTLGEFAQDSLKPTVFATMTLSRIRAKSFGRTAAPDAVATIDSMHNVAAALRRLSEGKLAEIDFLHQFGHRGPHEMELSQPRWSETGAPIPGGYNSARYSPASPARSPNRDEQTFAEFASLRETAKHYFMLGYSHLRRLLLEIDRRFALDGGAFFLTPDELPRLGAGDDLRSLIAERRRHCRVLTSLYVPSTVTSDNLEMIGCPPPATDSIAMGGIGLSGGIADGPALVLREPIDEPPDEPFVLVCPSTDPIWTPHFAKASAVVAETGGVLSHGAIVLREFGLPAVGGVANATAQLKSGQRLRVDGDRGIVTILEGT